MIKYLDELSNLHLPKKKYVIFGSGPLAIRNIRENSDLDILVTCDLWDELAKKYTITKKNERPDSIYIGNVQILKINYKNWGQKFPDMNILIKDSEIINGVPFTKLEYLLICKKLMDGEKHLKDISLIEKLLKEN